MCVCVRARGCVRVWPDYVRLLCNQLHVHTRPFHTEHIVLTARTRRHDVIRLQTDQSQRSMRNAHTHTSCWVCTLSTRGARSHTSLLLGQGGRSLSWLR